MPTSKFADLPLSLLDTAHFRFIISARTYYVGRRQWRRNKRSRYNADAPHRKGQSFGRRSIETRIRNWPKRLPSYAGMIRPRIRGSHIGVLLRNSPKSSVENRSCCDDAAKRRHQQHLKIARTGSAIKFAAERRCVRPSAAVGRKNGRRTTARTRRRTRKDDFLTSSTPFTAI